LEIEYFISFNFYLDCSSVDDDDDDDDNDDVGYMKGRIQNVIFSYIVFNIMRQNSSKMFHIVHRSI